MKSIKRRTISSGIISCFGLLTCIILLLFNVGVSEAGGHMFLASIIAATVIMMVKCLCEFRKLRTGRLITDNQILRIRTAVISNISAESAQMSFTENTEVIVSYFGILLDKKIIKFNQDCIRLKAVEIGGDFISFTYGTKKWIQNIRLLRQAIDSTELDEFMEKFRYETGITPTFSSQGIEGDRLLYKESNI